MKNYLLGILTGVLLALAVQGGVWAYEEVTSLDVRLTNMENYLSHVPFYGR